MHLAGRQREELLAARGITLPHCGEALIFIAKKVDFSPAASWFGLHQRNAVQDRPLEVLLHQGSDGTSKSRIHRDWEIYGAHFALFDKL